MKDQVFVFLLTISSFTAGFFAYRVAKWLNEFFLLEFWFKYYFRPKALKFDDHYLWCMNNTDMETFKFRSMEKKTLRAKIFLAALKALNEVNDYEG